jgi:tetratricopeptide (TPR) repeat protein
MTDQAKGRLVPGIPFVFSLLLSSLTVGNTVYWQDSGFFLTAVHDFSVLYPHGFVLYLVLCKAWTLATAPLVGFALSVHLFSALCAASGAAFAALAAKDFLRRIDPSKAAELPAIGAACLLAAGYSYAHAAILAKVYALSYALLALLLWLLVRAERKRDFVLLGAVLGFAWAAHPAAALLVPGLLGYAWSRRDRIREWGWGFFGGVVALAAACAFTPLLLLPVLASRESLTDMGNPRTAGELLAYLSGSGYTRKTGAFGISGWRILTALRFGWEEYLGGGILLVLAGTASLYRRRRAFLGLLAAWIVPVAAITIAFEAEGMIDQWLVVCYVPMTLLTACGLSRILEQWPKALPAVGGVSLLWLLVANIPALNQRGYDWAEQYGRMLLRNLDRRAVVIFSRDDPVGICWYLQNVRGERTDLLVLSSNRLGARWLDERISRQKGLPVPDYDFLLRMERGGSQTQRAVTAFANKNVGRVPAVFSDVRPNEEFLREDLTITPAGMLWKIAPRDARGVDLRYWDYPVTPESIPRKGKKARGIWAYETSEGSTIKPEIYEDRFFLPLLWARVRLGDLVLPSDAAKALSLYDSVLAAYPDAAAEARFVYHRGVALLTLNRREEGRAALMSLLALKPPPDILPFALFYLGEANRELRQQGEARRYYEEALRSYPPPQLRPVLEERLRSP